MTVALASRAARVAIVAITAAGAVDRDRAAVDSSARVAISAQGAVGWALTRSELQRRNSQILLLEQGEDQFIKQRNRVAQEVH